MDDQEHFEEFIGAMDHGYWLFNFTDISDSETVIQPIYAKKLLTKCNDLNLMSIPFLVLLGMLEDLNTLNDRSQMQVLTKLSDSVLRGFGLSSHGPSIYNRRTLIRFLMYLSKQGPFTNEDMHDAGKLASIVNIYCDDKGKACFGISKKSLAFETERPSSTVLTVFDTTGFQDAQVFIAAPPTPTPPAPAPAPTPPTTPPLKIVVELTKWFCEAFITLHKKMCASEEIMYEHTWNLRELKAKNAPKFSAT